MKTSALSLYLAATTLLMSSLGFSQTIINSVPYTISAPGNYQLGGNLIYTGAAGAAITINNNNVMLDLNQQFLYGPTSGAIAIYSLGKSDITIKNGQIIGFTVGVRLDPGDAGHLIQDLRVINCDWGILFNEATNCMIRNNLISTTSSSNTVGIFFTGGATGNCVFSNQVSGYGSWGGIFSNGNNYIVSNLVTKCTTGISTSSGDKYRFNTTLNCTTPFAGGGTALTDDNN